MWIKTEGGELVNTEMMATIGPEWTAIFGCPVSSYNGSSDASDIRIANYDNKGESDEIMRAIAGALSMNKPYLDIAQVLSAIHARAKEAK